MSHTPYLFPLWQSQQAFLTVDFDQVNAAATSALLRTAQVWEHLTLVLGLIYVQTCASLCEDCWLQIAHTMDVVTYYTIYMYFNVISCSFASHDNFFVPIGVRWPIVLYTKYHPPNTLTPHHWGPVSKSQHMIISCTLLTTVISAGGENTQYLLHDTNIEIHQTHGLPTNNLHSAQCMGNYLQKWLLISSVKWTLR